MDNQYSSAALIIGRALHPPWNEGTRVIGWNFAKAASTLRSIKVISLTHKRFITEGEGKLTIEHVPTQINYGMLGDYLGLPQIIYHINKIIATTQISVAHLIGGPLIIAPWLHHHKITVVAHVTIVEQAYEGSVERLRRFLARRFIDRWIDFYAVSSTALLQPLLQSRLSRSKIVVIPAAIDTSLYQPGDRNQVRTRLGLSINDFIILYIGTLSPLRFPTKMIREIFLQAGSLIKTNIRLFVFAPAVTHNYNQNWADYIKHQLQDIPYVKIEIAVQDMMDEEKIAWYQAADVMLLPFVGPVAVEPPLTLLEGMGCGSIVLATSQSNHSQLIKSGYNGFIWETPEEVSALLVNIFHKRYEPEIQCIREKARVTILGQHSLASAAKAMAQLWEIIARNNTVVGKYEPT